MKTRTIAALSATFPTNLALPILCPREAWPDLIERGADVICPFGGVDAQTLIQALRDIAARLREEVSA